MLRGTQMNTIHKIAARFILSVAAVAITATAVLSAPITVPAGLNPGDQYRLAFVTNTTRVATSSNIADYNAFVTAVANSQTELAALGTTWMAIASTATVDARDNTGTNLNSSTGFPVYLLDETRIADNNADLWSGNIVVPFKVTQTGTSARTIEVWTGTNGDGTARSFRALGETFAVTGITNATNLLWVINGVNRASTPRPFYALSGVLTVAPAAHVAEPGALGVLAVGLVCLAVLRRRKFAA
jgi:hypothetical protein